MSASVQLELLLSITGDCLSLLSEGQVEEYLSLEGERRHLLDSLPGDFPSACKPQLEQLQALTEALTAEVKHSLAQMQSQVGIPGPPEASSGFSSWA
jgi:hypothetical protein